MANSHLTQLAYQLEQQILASPDNARAPLHARLHRVLDEMRLSGVPVPLDLRHLDRDLTEAETEDQFDNMPV